jgi:hypothetical protein
MTGETTTDLLFEVSVIELGAVLTDKSLFCATGASTSACLIKGDVPGGSTVGEVVVGKGDKWSMIDKTFGSDAHYLSLIDVNGGGEGKPDVVAVLPGYYVQVFQLDGTEIGCTRTPVPDQRQLPGWPNIKPPTATLKPCPV